MHSLLGDIPFVKTPYEPTSQGKVRAVKGSTLIAQIPLAGVGDLCEVEVPGKPALSAEVISFQDEHVLLSPFDEPNGIRPGALVTKIASAFSVYVPSSPLGYVLDAMGRPLNKPFDDNSTQMRIKAQGTPPAALKRKPINAKLETGVKIIDSLCPLGYGQRVAISASAGVGKSTLIGMITRNAQVDATVIALVGERGREVNEFIDECLGPDGLKKAVVVVATSDESAGRRWLAPQIATGIAETLRDQGLNVLLVVDSLTRSARALREIGLSAGELPVRQGYTAAVYTQLPKLLERAGRSEQGSITALYTLLSSSEQEHDALSEEVKSLLDGHLVLSNYMVRFGVRPAIDPLLSLSRLASRFTSLEAQKDIDVILSALKRLQNDKDVLLLGGIPDPELKAALTHETELVGFLSQMSEQNIPNFQSQDALRHMAARLRQTRAELAKNNGLGTGLQKPAS